MLSLPEMNIFRNSQPTILSMFSRVGSAISQFTQANRMDVNIASAMVCVLVADAFVQLVFERRKVLQENSARSYNYWRTARVVAVAAILCAVSHTWYGALNRAYETDGLRDFTAKIVLDEVVMAPAVITTFIFAVGLLEGNRLKSVYEEWKRKFTEIYQTDVFVWPPVQLFNLVVVPVQFRLVYINVCALFWYVYLSKIKHSKKEVPTLGAIKSNYNSQPEVNERPAVTIWLNRSGYVHSNPLRDRMM